MPNRAFTLGDLCNDGPSRLSWMEVSRAALAPRGKGCACVWREGNKVFGLATERPRSGPRSWEITQLAARPGSDSHLPALLDKMSRTAARNGGQRLFLRLQRDDPLVDVARLSGFFPCVLERLYGGPPDANGSGPASARASIALRAKTRSDEYELFRLYNTATPPEVRRVVGMTFDQWLSSLERPYGRCREFALEKNGAVRGWLRAVRRSRVGSLAAMVHPDQEHCLSDIVDFGLRRMKGMKMAYCLVPEYQVALQSILVRKGFEAISDYITLVKSMAVREGEEARACVTVAST